MQEDLKERISAFIRYSNATSVYGSRRMGRSGLMDAVQDVLLDLYSDSKIIRINDGDSFDPSVVAGYNFILIVDPQIMSCFVDTLKRYICENVLLFSTQELCHQVPVCIKGLHGLDRYGCHCMADLQIRNS